MEVAKAYGNGEVLMFYVLLVKKEKEEKRNRQQKTGEGLKCRERNNDSENRWDRREERWKYERERL